MDAIFAGSMECAWKLTISSASLNEVYFSRLARMTSSLSTFASSSDNSSHVKASDWALMAKVMVMSSVLSDRSGSPLIVITQFGPGIFNFMYA